MYFKYMEKYDYEKVVLIQDQATGLKGIICIHNSNLGPALGGARLYNYNNEEDAILDALRLARGMTYKAAAANLPLGGGKAVLIGDPTKIKSQEYFNKFGEHIESLSGKYITAEDMNTTTTDMMHINEKTSYVTGLEGSSGDPSPITALGAFYGLKAALMHKYGNSDISKYSFAIQGAGATGSELIKHLVENDAKAVYYSEVNEKNINRISSLYKNVKLITNDELFNLDVNCLVPCAFGGIINDNTIKNLKVDIICGTANNILLDEVKHGNDLKEKGILYAPDFIVNAGGLINVYHEMIGYNLDEVLKDVELIYGRTLEILENAENKNITTQEAAFKYANNVLVNGIK